MIRIAILDSAVDAQKLRNCKSFQHVNLCTTDTPDTGDTLSHGTLCAMVLNACATDYELISVQIFNSREHKTFGDPGVLAQALQVCHDLGADVINLSAATSVLSDSAMLYEVSAEAARDAILVAALDNRRFMSIPASYPFAIGVQCAIRLCTCRK